MFTKFFVAKVVFLDNSRCDFEDSVGFKWSTRTKNQPSISVGDVVELTETAPFEAEIVRILPTTKKL